MPQDKTTRRKFLKGAGTATAAIALPSIIPASALGRDGATAPSERIVMGGIGIGNMGKGDQGNFLGQRGVQYVAVSDVRKSALNHAKGKADGHYKNKDCAAYNDYRELLARDDIDAVHIATPDHWHAIQIIDACRAGKDVYCQKPESRTLREGPLIVDTARRYGRVVSGGSQRVAQDYRGIVNECWSGKKGPVKSINVNVGPLSQLCNLPPEDVPDDIDWEMWLGPAPWAPYNGKRCSGNFSTGGNSWRSYLDYSGGGMTDWGAHHFGGATYAVDVRELQPQEVDYHNEGGKAHLTFKFPNGMHITHNKPGKKNMEVDGTPGETREAKEIPTYIAKKGGIYADFLLAVRNRTRPFRDIEYAINTMSVCHLGILAHTLQRSLKWDVAKQEFIGDPEANRYRDRARREPWQL
jgi:predicted dehydrogenase